MPADQSRSKAPVAIWPDSVPSPLAPYSPAIKAGGWVFVSGQVATDFKTGVAPGALSANPNLGDTLELQARYTLQNLKKAIAAAGCDISKDAVRIWQWITTPHPTIDDFKAGDYFPRTTTISSYFDVRNEFINEPRPASTAIGVREMMIKDTILEVDMICIDDGGESIGYATPEGIPSPIAGYSPALRRGDWVFLAGEIPTDFVGDFSNPMGLGEPSSLAKEARINPYFWYGSEIEKQTDFVLWKLSKIAEAAGTSFDRAVKAEVYIGSASEYAGMDKVWKRWFPQNPPARFVVPSMGLNGKGSRIEIALTLLANDSSLKIETIKTDKAPKPFSHEPQAVKAGNFLFLSQQMACDEKGALIPEGARNPAFPYYGMTDQAQVRYMLKNVAAICEAAGTKLENVVHRICFHNGGEHFAEAMQEWAAHFPERKPCSTTLLIDGPLVVPGASTLLDLIAYVPD
jgi:enamine deaminase RidA (YjgF/YER057c/UK114 family)